MPHPLWKGSIGFGLVDVPVSLYAGTTDQNPASDDVHRLDILYCVAWSSLEARPGSAPYYLAPGPGASIGYLLLREALERSGRVGVTQTRLGLAALIPWNRSLLLILLQFGPLRAERVAADRLVREPDLIEAVCCEDGWDHDLGRQALLTWEKRPAEPNAGRWPKAS